MEDKSSHSCRGSHCAVFDRSGGRQSACIRLYISHTANAPCIFCMRARDCPHLFSSLNACPDPSQSSRLIWLGGHPQPVYADLDLRPRLANALPYDETIAKQNRIAIRSFLVKRCSLGWSLTPSWHFGRSHGPTMIASTSE